MTPLNSLGSSRVLTKPIACGHHPRPSQKPQQRCLLPLHLPLPRKNAGYRRWHAFWSSVCQLKSHSSPTKTRPNVRTQRPLEEQNTTAIAAASTPKRMHQKLAAPSTPYGHPACPFCPSFITGFVCRMQTASQPRVAQSTIARSTQLTNNLHPAAFNSAASVQNTVTDCST